MIHKKILHMNGGKPRNYPWMCQSVDSSTASGHTVMDIMSVTLSDLESRNEKFGEFYNLSISYLAFFLF